MGLKEKLSMEVNKAVLPEMQNIMVKAHEQVKDSQRAFLDEVAAKMKLWKIEIVKEVDEQVKKSLEESKNEQSQDD